MALNASGTVAFSVLPPAGRHGMSSRRRRRLTITLVTASVLLVLAALGAWYALGTKDLATQIKADALGAKDDLSAAQTLFDASDAEGAQAKVVDAQAKVANAQSLATDWRLSLASRFPTMATPIEDLDLLLESAEVVTGAAGQAFEVYDSVAGANSTLYAGGRIDLAELDRVIGVVGTLGADLATARSLLEQVDGTHAVEGGVPEARDAAIAQIDEIQGRIAGVEPFLAALPPAVGAAGPKQYVVTILNPAELRYGGGAPLSYALVRFEEGQLSILLKGSNSRLTNGDPLISYPPVANNPWHEAADEVRLGDSTSAANWTIAGEELARGFEATFERPVDGVIALDPVAIAALLEKTGPIESAGYGTIDHTNAVDVLLGSYDRFGDDQKERQDLNAQLMDAMVAQLSGGGGMLGKVQALGQAGEGRHVQLYFRDAGLQALAADTGLTWGLADTPNDYLGVFNRNWNGSKTDYYLQRDIASTVRLQPDGSAQVTTRVRLANDTPPYAGPSPDPGIGYLTRWNKTLAGFYLPTGAVLGEVLLGREGRDLLPADPSPFLAGGTELGREFVVHRADIRPNSVTVLQYDYTVPVAATVNPDGTLRYSVTIERQALVKPDRVSVTVVPPAGWQASGDGWGPVEGGVARSAEIDRRARWALDLRQG